MTPIQRREMSRMERIAEKFAASRPGGWFFVNIGNKIDPTLLKLTRGRFNTGGGAPVLLLIARGAKSGKPRETPLLYFTDGDDVVMIASNAGGKRHPAWYGNVTAHPDVELFVRGRSGRYVAREAQGAERERLWELANDLYAGYDVYQVRAGDRRIPVIVCSPAGASPGPERRTPAGS
jgi:deazaflavin-dependent oxidoreductase (nitroreductase family)